MDTDNVRQESVGIPFTYNVILLNLQTGYYIVWDDIRQPHIDRPLWVG